MITYKYNPNLYMVELKKIFNDIHNNKEKLKAFLKLDNFKVEIERMNKVLYNAIFNDFSEQENIDYLFIINSDDFTLFNYCTESYPNEDDDEISFVSYFTSAIITKDYSSIYFLLNDVIIRYSLEDNIPIKRIIKNDIYFDGKISLEQKNSDALNESNKLLEEINTILKQ